MRDRPDAWAVCFAAAYAGTGVLWGGIFTGRMEIAAIGAIVSTVLSLTGLVLRFR